MSPVKTYEYMILARHGTRADAVERNYRGAPFDTDLSAVHLPSMQRVADRVLAHVPAAALRDGIAFHSSPFRRCVQTAAVYATAARTRFGGVAGCDTIHLEPYLGEDGAALVYRDARRNLYPANLNKIAPLALGDLEQVRMNAEDALRLSPALMSGAHVAGVTLSLADMTNLAAHIQREQAGVSCDATELARRTGYFKLYLDSLPHGPKGPTRVIVSHAGVSSVLLAQLTGKGIAECPYFAQMESAVVLRREAGEREWRVHASTYRSTTMALLLIVLLAVTVAAFVLYRLWLSRNG